MIDGRLRVDPFTGTGWDLNLVRDAKAHFERARMVDPSNVVAEAFLSQVSLHTTLAMCTHGRLADPLFLPLWRLVARVGATRAGSPFAGIR